ncbi:hypothetical protein ALC56_06459 [Trachymyrmex septentrionalis]|uniref:C2HC/C3H-type domain-containing protein n=1 Tax=Trachymyrmex septentrionalis TaxID=34720 RepID=A0A195FF68_9HYME|nr:PREDICTED: uncharacterized protein LOC108748688 [Trachymyrmex septentrionalis]KYN39033.1 hypothetical protein ALC56_06459 [Trachymyrmex septentrionalis]
MKGTKLRTRATLPSNSKNIGIQTENFDSLIEIAKLEEQVKVMQLEINILRKHMGTLKKPDVASHKTVSFSSAVVKLNVEKSSCGCKGNCLSRICGCVKKNIRCNPSCKCDDKACQNQKLDQNQEDKENINRIDVTHKNKNRKKNGTTEKLNRHLFSPDNGELSKVFEEIDFSGIDFSSNEKNTSAISTQTDLYSIDKVKLKTKKKKEENKEQQESMDVQITFDPMKPRHQLSRTPPKKLEKSLEVDVTIQPQLHFEPTREIISSHTYQDTNEENVNWKEHTAQLIPCKKCKRTFMPNRIQKHETCCKG